MDFFLFVTRAHGSTTIHEFIDCRMFGDYAKFFEQSTVEQADPVGLVLRPSVGASLRFSVAEKALRQVDDEWQILEEFRSRIVTLSVHPRARADRQGPLPTRLRLRQRLESTMLLQQRSHPLREDRSSQVCYRFNGYSFLVALSIYSDHYNHDNHYQQMTSTLITLITRNT